MKTLAKNKYFNSKLKNKKIQGGLFSALHFVCGFILSMSVVLNIASPFAISFVSVSKKKYFIYSALGAAFGYLAFSPRNFPRYAVAVAIVTLGTFAMAIAKAKSEPFLPMLISFLALLSTGVVLNVKTGGVLADYGFTLAESIIGAGGAFFFFKLTTCNFTRLKYKALPSVDMTCLLISCSIILMSLSKVTILGISPARIFAILLILTTIKYGNDRWGMIFALSLGFTLGISKENTLFLLGAYGFSALIASLFVQFGSFSTALSFAVSISFFSIASADSSVSLYIFIESLIGSIIFILLPEVITEKIESLWNLKTDYEPDGSLRQSLVVKLRFASSAMSTISESVNEVREKINSINSRNDERLKDILSEEEYITNEIINEKTNEIRMVAGDQFFSIADMLSDLAKEFDEAEHFDPVLAGRIRRELGDYEIYPQNISVINDKYGRTRVEILTSTREKNIENPKIRDEISHICNKYFENGNVTYFKNDSVISFAEKPNYSVEIGFTQHSAEGKLCGDTIKTVNDSKGHTVLIISDGMGKGGRAALDGAMGAGLLSKLLSAGFGFDSALKVVNSALLVKSNDESLTTLDCASIDLFTGRVDLYKAGAPASYILKSGRISKCELTSMPAGILRGIEFAKRTAVLSDGNYLIMMSDGITDIGDKWLELLMSGFEYESPQEIADEILRQALSVSEGRKEDDMSIIVLRINTI